MKVLLLYILAYIKEKTDMHKILPFKMAQTQIPKNVFFFFLSLKLAFDFSKIEL